MNNVSQRRQGSDDDAEEPVRGSEAGRTAETMSDARLTVAPIDSRETFKDKAYVALKSVIVSMDVYRSRADIRLDERHFRAFLPGVYR